MIIKLEMTKDTPLYEQLKQSIVEAIARGELQPGEPLPSVRQLAADLSVNMHTVAKAYGQLKDEGFVTVHRKKGAVVSHPAHFFLMLGVERIFAIAVHIGLTMFVLYAVKQRKIWCFILAIFVHGLIDTVYPLFRVLSNWAADGIFALFAVIAVIFAARIKPALKAIEEGKDEKGS